MEAEKDLKYVEIALKWAIAHNRTYSDIWFVKSDNDNEAKQYITKLVPASLIINKLPALNKKDDRYSILITYAVKTDGEKSETRTRAYIYDASDEQNITEAVQWVMDNVESVARDLFVTTYDVTYAITEHIENHKEFTEKVLNAARTMLGNSSDHLVHWQMPKYTSSLLRTQNSGGMMLYTDFDAFLDKIVDLFSEINS